MGAILGEHGGWQVAQRFSGGEGEKAAARERVALADLSYMGKLLLEGQEAGSLLEVIWNVPSLDVNQGAMIDPGTVYSLRSDLVFISLSPGAEGPAIVALEGQAAKLNFFVTVTHMTDAWFELLLIGPASAELLRAVPTRSRDSTRRVRYPA